MYRSYFALSLTLCLALGVLALVPSVGNAGIILNPATVDLTCGPGATAPLWSFEVKGFWDFTTADLPSYTSTGSTNWEFTLTPTTIAGTPFKALFIAGNHLVAPHSPEFLPSSTFVGGVVFPNIAASGGTAFGNIAHNEVGGGPHKDSWRLEALVNAAATGADLRIVAFHPVPEPSSLALLGVGSLIGLGVYSRRRRKNA